MTKPPRKRKTVEDLLPLWNNPGIDLCSLTPGSGKTYIWKHQNEQCGCIHIFEKPLRQMYRTLSNGCSICTFNDAPCCDKFGLAGDANFQTIAHEWSFKNEKTPNYYSPKCSQYVWWEHKAPACNCTHLWEASIQDRIRGDGCGICSHRVPPCCLIGTIASDPKLLVSWDVEKNNALGLTADKTYIRSGIAVWWLCFDTCKEQQDCIHSWKASPNRRADRGCPYHSFHKKPCCIFKSLAAPRYADYIREWDHDANKITPRDCYVTSHILVKWICTTASCACIHRWDAYIDKITCSRIENRTNKTCPFCRPVPAQICCAKHPSSLANTTSIQIENRLQYFVQDGIHNVSFENIALIAKGGHQNLWFQCPKCIHLFCVLPYQFAKGAWCQYCFGRQSCLESDCKTCKQFCEVCISRHARYITPISKTKSCRTCLDDIIKRNPRESPLAIRAKITLEIYCLAELQSMASATNWLLQECTTWDCPILPTLSIRPDNMWIFSKSGDVFETVGACKMNLDQIGYVAQLEIIEHSRKVHSNARQIADEDRESQIRTLFNSHGIALGLVYCTVAHTKHIGAHPEDVFFKKNLDTGEYEVMDDKQIAWQERIAEVFHGLVSLVETRSNETLTFGN